MPFTIAKRPLKVFLCHVHIIPLRDSDASTVRAFGGRVGGGFRYAKNATQPPPYRDHNRLTKDGVD